MNVLFDSPVRYLITPGSLTPDNFQSEKDPLLETIWLAVVAGIELVQIREKSLTGRQLFELTVEAASIVRFGCTRLLINERFDIAIAAGADGVHLTSMSIPAGRVRSSVGQDFLIGVSAHSLAEVKTARCEDADFVMLGPVFATPGKGEPLGLDEFEAICCAEERFPVIAIGGVDTSNADDVLAAGASGFASIRYLNDFVRMAR